jgi:hypothetical protein
MTWIRIANTAPTHPKILQAGPGAAYLWWCSICWSDAQSTDGRIPRQGLSIIAPGLSRPDRHARTLCDVGLWESTATGWRIHDYLDHQQSAAEKQARSDAARNAARMRWASEPHSARHALRIADSNAEEVEEKEGPPVVPPRGGRQRDREKWERAVTAYAGEHFPQLDRGERIRAVRQAVIYGQAETLEQVISFIREHFPLLAEHLADEG